MKFSLKFQPFIKKTDLDVLVLSWEIQFKVMFDKETFFPSLYTSSIKNHLLPYYVIDLNEVVMMRVLKEKKPFEFIS